LVKGLLVLPEVHRADRNEPVGTDIILNQYSTGKVKWQPRPVFQTRK
jgi:hypothetical protein